MGFDMNKGIWIDKGFICTTDGKARIPVDDSNAGRERNKINRGGKV